MSCFGAAYYSPSSGIGGGRRPWRWWRAKCAGIAAAVGSRLRRSIRGIDGRRRRRTSFPSSSYVHAQPHRHSHHRRSFAPVYVDELYSHQHQPAAKATLRVVQQDYEPPTSTRDAAKLAAPAAAAPPAVHAAKLTPAAAAPSAVHAAAGATARATGGKPSADACRRVVPPRVCGGAAATAAVRNVLLRSPGRGGGGVLGAVKGMGEVDLRAELFIRKFKEDMRLQSQRSAEEFQAMLARGL